MANNDVELEIKLPLKNPEEVKNFLGENAELISKDVFQKDTYFIPTHRNFLNTEYPFEWLRLRESDKGSSINYKHFYPENVKETDYCDEFESGISKVDTIKKIFRSLDIKEVVVVEKVRTTWMFEGVEIVIDNVKGLGVYIELEATSHFEDPKEGKKFLYEILEKLNAKVGGEDLRGNPFRLLEKQGHKFGE